MNDEMPRTAWTSGCDSWYLDANGPTLRPFLAPEHRAVLARPDLAEFELRPTAEGERAVS